MQHLAKKETPGATAPREVAVSNTEPLVRDLPVIENQRLYAPVEDIQQRLKLLHDLLETKDITPKEYDKKVKQVVARI